MEIFWSYKESKHVSEYAATAAVEKIHFALCYSHTHTHTHTVAQPTKLTTQKVLSVEFWMGKWSYVIVEWLSFAVHETGMVEESTIII